MSNSESIVQSLLSGIEFEDNRLYDVLQKIASDLYRVDNQLNPPTVSGAFGLTGQILLPSDITNFIATIVTNNVHLSWDQLDGLVSYEIRYHSGNNTNWDTASVILKTSTVGADINPLTVPLIYGDHTFLIKSIDSSGNYSGTASYIVINIPQIQAPIISASVIGNFVLLYWTVPSSTFDIAYYNIKKDGALQGKMNGTFEAIFESTGGTFTYVIEPVDIVGNVGIDSAGLQLLVSNPADFTLHASITSVLAGTKTNCVEEDIATTKYLLACNIVETYQQHFVNNGWASPQAQVTAGYDLFIEPTNLTGKYVEVFDFGSIISNIIAVSSWNTIAINGAITTNTSTLETSTDAITWSTPAVGNSIFGASVRYVRLTMNFVASSNKALAYFYNIQCLLNVHREQDGGSQAVLAADAAGTVVTLNKAFLSIDTITVTPVGTVLLTAVYDFAFPVNPTTFKVKLYNAAGARVNGNITWIARGII